MRNHSHWRSYCTEKYKLSYKVIPVYLFNNDSNEVKKIATLEK